MKNLYLNHLSINAFLDSKQNLEQAISEFISILKFLIPALASKTIYLLYSPEFESRGFVRDEHFRQSLSKIDQKLQMLWWQYLKSYGMVDKQADGCLIIRASDAQNNILDITCQRKISKLVFDTSNFISFIGHPVFRTNQLQLFTQPSTSKAEQTTFDVTNMFSELCVKKNYPLYKKSDKHRDEPYYDSARGEHVAPMPYSDDIAQELILSGIFDPASTDIFKFEPKEKKIVKFKVTLNNEYHGYVVTEKEVPQAILQRLLDGN